MLYDTQILGLEICADTMVGNDMLRGISGGQRKRVTTGKESGSTPMIMEAISCVFIQILYCMFVMMRCNYL